MGAPSQERPRHKVRAHLSASQRKVGLGECHLSLADPLARPNPDGHASRCILVRSSAYSTSSPRGYVYILILAGTDLFGL